MKWSLHLSLIHRQRYSLMLALSLLLVWPGAAWSHAFPQEKTPAPEARLKEAPTEVKILFSSALEAPFCYLRVTNRQGHAVNRGRSRVSDDNPHLLVAPLVPSLDPGTYTVHWRVAGRDGHITHGEYQFRILSGAQ